MVALFFVDSGLVGVGEEGGVINLFYFGVALQVFGDALGIFALAVHAEVDGGEAGVENPAFVGLENVSKEAALAADFCHQGGVFCQDYSADDVAIAAEIFGGGINGDVGTEGDGVLEGRAEEGVVDHDEGRVRQGGGGLAGLADVGHDDGRIGRGFDEDDFQVTSGLDGVVQGGGVAGGDGDAGDAEGLEKSLDQGLGTAVNGDGINDAVAGGDDGQHGGHDSGHAGIEDSGAGGGGFEREDLLFEDLGVGVVEAGIDEIYVFVGGALGAAGHEIEGAFCCFGAGEDVGGTAKDGGTGRAD